MTEKVRYWHGGFPGLAPGSFVLPPSETKTDRNLQKYTKELQDAGFVGADYQRIDRVYVTTDRTFGRCYAAMYPNGTLYEVEPVGELAPDPDAKGMPGVSYEVEKARVLRVVEPRITRTFWWGFHTLVRRTKMWPDV